VEKEVFAYDLIPLLCLYTLTEGKISSKVVISIALSLLKENAIYYYFLNTGPFHETEVYLFIL